MCIYYCMMTHLRTGRSIFIYTHIDTNIYMYIFKYTGIYSNIAIEKRLSLKVSNVCFLFFIRKIEVNFYDAVRM